MMKSGARFAVGALAVVAVSMIGGRHLENHFLPVFTEVEFVVVKESVDKSELLFRGVKNRSCLLLSASATVANGQNTVVVAPTMLNEDGTRLSKADQRISVGDRFVRIVKVDTAGSLQEMRITSQCHPFWLTEQTVRLN